MAIIEPPRDAEAVVRSRHEEVQLKLERVRAAMEHEQLDGVLFSKQLLVSWIGAGRNSAVVRGSDPSLVPGRAIESALLQARLALMPTERRRLQALGEAATRALETTVREITRGTTEREVAAELARRLELAAIFPSVLMVGADRRRRQFRHPLVDAGDDGPHLVTDSDSWPTISCQVDGGTVERPAILELNG